MKFQRRSSKRWSINSSSPLLILMAMHDIVISKFAKSASRLAVMIAVTRFRGQQCCCLPPKHTLIAVSQSATKILHAFRFSVVSCVSIDCRLFDVEASIESIDCNSSEFNLHLKLRFSTLFSEKCWLPNRTIRTAQNSLGKSFFRDL
ncbi:hypothetical protein L1887_62325 [Cichorium endivia]|nr:hypothetical protein L1887_62325 [Cichorium endivia]